MGLECDLEKEHMENWVALQVGLKQRLKRSLWKRGNLDFKPGCRLGDGRVKNT